VSCYCLAVLRSGQTGSIASVKRPPPWGSFRLGFTSLLSVSCLLIWCHNSRRTSVNNTVPCTHTLCAITAAGCVTAASAIMMSSSQFLQSNLMSQCNDFHKYDALDSFESKLMCMCCRQVCAYIYRSCSCWGWSSLLRLIAWPKQASTRSSV